MSYNQRGESPFAARAAATGYLYQCRYALYESLRRLRTDPEFTVSVEALDDVIFEKGGEPSDVLQTKHHLSRTASLTNASPDLWKTIRVWAETALAGKLPTGAGLMLVTTATAPEGTAASYLKPGPTRDVAKAIQRLQSTAETSTSKDNTPAYTAFRKLSAESKMDLFDASVVIDAQPGIVDLDKELKSLVFYAVERRFLDSFLDRLEGWWLRRVIKQLVGDAGIILSEEVDAERNLLREQFKQDNLPVDPDIMQATIDASGYQDRVFVHQLRLIEIGNKRIYFAIRDYFRAFEQRSRWVREDLVHVGELGRYEDRLVEEWERHFERMREELGGDAVETARKEAGRALFAWIETGDLHTIREGVRERWVAQGTYQVLSDKRRVGWHPEFAARLHELLDAGGES